MRTDDDLIGLVINHILERPNYPREGQPLPEDSGDEYSDDDEDKMDEDHDEVRIYKDDNPTMECGCCTLDFPFEDFVQVLFAFLPSLQVIEFFSLQFSPTFLPSSLFISAFTNQPLLLFNPLCSLNSPSSLAPPLVSLFVFLVHGGPSVLQRLCKSLHINEGLRRGLR